jgi:hypothetical protein
MNFSLGNNISAVIFNVYKFGCLRLFAGKKLQGGEKVKVIGGEFAGIEEKIYRIKGHKRVIVRLGKDLAVATES